MCAPAPSHGHAGVYVALYFVFTLANYRYCRMWVYPIFATLTEKVGFAGFWLLAVPVAVAYLGAGFLGQAIAG